MDQIKIGKFISKCRKEKNLTQMQLAEKLGITDRAISKWETGKSLPDSSIMLELCEMLGITVNDLLSGEVVTM
ncbi:MAG: helix-turn-helix transcriptional regulator, partial [Ruminococcus sp.]|nr:helix-turn-helix transcriptional regulator [Ruminococcus sp.]